MNFWTDNGSFASIFFLYQRQRLITGCVAGITRWVPLVELEQPTLPEHLSSPSVFSGVRVTRSLVLYVCFVDRCLFFYTFSFGHCGCLFFFDIRILFTSLVSSSSASWTTVRFFKIKYTVFISGTMLLKFSFTSAKRFEVFLYDLLIILWFNILKTSRFKHNSYIERDKRLYYIISAHIKLKIK